MNVTDKDAETAILNRKLSFVVVDDHEIVRYGVSRVLEQNPNWRVLGQCEDSASAIDMISVKRPDFVIMDISLRGIDGIHLTRIIRQDYPEVRVIIFSMHDEELYARQALSAGASGYVMKDRSPAELISALSTVVLRNAIYVSEAIQTDVLRNFASPDKAAAGCTIDILSDRERQVYHLIGQGLTTRQIAENLFVSIKTIETHRARIKDKLNIPTSAKLVMHASRWVSNDLNGRGAPENL